MSELVANKVAELATESIPGCILQIIVLLKNPDRLSFHLSLASILVSSLVTGFTSAIISFNMDVDPKRRRSQPQFYGYVPIDRGGRNRCFCLMVVMATLHNISRSVGCALLFACESPQKNNLFLMSLIIGEVGVYLIYKVVRGDFHCWYRFDAVSGTSGIVLSLCSRALSKIVTDFSGCLHFRHPYVASE